MRVAVFDLDGTLADTAADLIAAANAALAEAGLGRRARPGAATRRSPSPAGGRCCGGGSAGRGGSTRRWSSGSIRGCWRVYGEGIAVETRLYDGAEAALGRLDATGWGLAVCTNKPEGLAVRLLDALGIGGRFRAVLGADTLALRKPDPRHLDRDDRAGGGRAASGRCWSATRSTTARRRARRGFPACWSASGPRAPGRRRWSPRRCSRISTSCRTSSSGWCRRAPADRGAVHQCYTRRRQDYCATFAPRAVWGRGSRIQPEAHWRSSPRTPPRTRTTGPTPSWNSPTTAC